MSASAPFWVQSLTAFQKHFFGIEDKLSYERQGPQMVRLQNIRFVAILPHPLGSRTRRRVLYPHADDPMRASTLGKRRQDLTAKLVARLLFVSTRIQMNALPS
jgi:hypothetical protein